MGKVINRGVDSKTIGRPISINTEEIESLLRRCRYAIALANSTEGRIAYADYPHSGTGFYWFSDKVRIEYIFSDQKPVRFLKVEKRVDRTDNYDVVLKLEISGGTITAIRAIKDDLVWELDISANFNRLYGEDGIETALRT